MRLLPPLLFLGSAASSSAEELCRKPELPALELRCPPGAEPREEPSRCKGKCIHEHKAWCEKDGQRHGIHAVWTPTWKETRSKTTSSAPAVARAFEQARREGRLRTVARYQNGLLQWETRHHSSYGRSDVPKPRFAPGQVRVLRVVTRQDTVVHDLFPTGELLRRTRMVGDVPDGPVIECHQNGKPWVTGRFVGGLPDGTWRHWDQKGGELPASRLNRGSGLWREWHANGRPALRGQLLGGKPEGEWVAWNEDGRQALRGTFKGGKLRLPFAVEGRPARRTQLQLLACSGLDPVVVERILGRHGNEVKYCWQKELCAAPDLGGHLVVELEVDARGQVSTNRIAETTVGSSMVDECVAAAHRRWLFPRPGAGAARITVSHHFGCERPWRDGRLQGLVACYHPWHHWSETAALVRQGRVLLRLPDPPPLWRDDDAIRH